MARASGTSKSDKSNGKGAPQAAEAYEDLVAQIEALKADLAALTTAVSNVGRAETERLAATARETRDAVKESGERRAAEVRDASERVVREGESLVRENPMMALGIVAGLGFLFGFFSRR